MLSCWSIVGNHPVTFSHHSQCLSLLCSGCIAWFSAMENCAGTFEATILDRSRRASGKLDLASRTPVEGGQLYFGHSSPKLRHWSCRNSEPSKRSRSCWTRNFDNIDVYRLSRESNMLVESRSSDNSPSMNPALGHGVAAKVVNILLDPHQCKRLKLYRCLDGSPTRAHIVALPLCRVKGTFIDNNPIPVAKERFRFMPFTEKGP